MNTPPEVDSVGIAVVSKPGSEEEERSYRGPDGSDAARVFFGYQSKCKV